MNGENTACFYPVSPFLTFNLDQLSCILGDVNALLHNTIDSYNRLYMDGLLLRLKRTYYTRPESTELLAYLVKELKIFIPKKIKKNRMIL